MFREADRRAEFVQVSRNKQKPLKRHCTNVCEQMLRLPLIMMVQWICGRNTMHRCITSVCVQASIHEGVRPLPIKSEKSFEPQDWTLNDCIVPKLGRHLGQHNDETTWKLYIAASRDLTILNNFSFFLTSGPAQQVTNPEYSLIHKSNCQ